jgi:DNA-binding MarR family transcriptional regulator
MSDFVEPGILVALRRITRAMDLHSRALHQSVGLTRPQLASLLVVSQREPISTGDIAREIHLGHATVTGILDRLEQRTLVERWRSEVDRRSVLVRITSDGRKLLAVAPTPLPSNFSARLNGLPDWEKNLIVSVLQRTAAMLGEDDIASTDCVEQAAN